MKNPCTIEKLPHLEYAGDWHDKPFKYIVKTPYDCNQKFSTKKEALLWMRLIWKNKGDFKKTFREWMDVE
jgi:hypothetical protein